MIIRGKNHSDLKDKGEREREKEREREREREREGGREKSLSHV